jgi:ribosome recycling factor
MFDKIFKDASQKMDKAMEAMMRDFGHLRTGRAHVGLVEHVTVELYGSQQPLKAVANLSTPDASTILITPWDRTSLGTIEKALQAADLGMNPSSDGINIRLSVPALTQERRKSIAKEAHKIAEHGRVSVRTIRQHANDELKKLEKAKEISEDDLKKALKKVQDLTDKHIKDIDTALARKEEEIMQV